MKTAESLVDGWCSTGDAVNVDDFGHLIFLDRLEHMGKLRSGTKYAPQYPDHDTSDNAAHFKPGGFTITDGNTIPR